MQISKIPPILIISSTVFSHLNLSDLFWFGWIALQFVAAVLFFSRERDCLCVCCAVIAFYRRRE